MASAMTRGWEYYRASARARGIIGPVLWLVVL